MFSEESIIRDSRFDGEDSDGSECQSIAIPLLLIDFIKNISLFEYNVHMCAAEFCTEANVEHDDHDILQGA